MPKRQKTEPCTKCSPILRRIILLTACIFLLENLDVLLREGMRYQEEDSRYRRVAECYAPVYSAVPESAGTPQEALLDVDFAALQSAYPNAAAWIAVDNTDISYPVMQAQDNVYYLTHAVDGTQTKSGALFLDCRCARDDPYWIIYGHNMKDRSMFGSLKEFEQQSTFAQKGGGLTLYTPEHIWRYQIFAVRILSAEDKTFLPRSQKDAEYSAFLDNIKSSALYDTGVSCGEADDVLVLSTCTGTNGAQRLVLYACRQDEVLP